MNISNPAVLTQHHTLWLLVALHSLQKLCKMYKNFGIVFHRCISKMCVMSFCRYLQQFQDLYTEEGRKSVKICTYVPGQHHVSQVMSASQVVSQTTNSVTQTSATTANVKVEPGTSDHQQVNVAASTNSAVAMPSNGLAVPLRTTLSSNATVSPVVQSCNLSSVRTYGQKLAMFQQRGTVVGSVTSGAAATVAGVAKISTAGWYNVCVCVCAASFCKPLSPCAVSTNMSDLHKCNIVGLPYCDWHAVPSASVVGLPYCDWHAVPSASVVGLPYCDWHTVPSTVLLHSYKKACGCACLILFPPSELYTITSRIKGKCLFSYVCVYTLNVCHTSYRE